MWVRVGATVDGSRLHRRATLGASQRKVAPASMPGLPQAVTVVETMCPLYWHGSRADSPGGCRVVVFAGQLATSAG